MTTATYSERFFIVERRHPQWGWQEVEITFDNRKQAHDWIAANGSPIDCRVRTRRAFA